MKKLSVEFVVVVVVLTPGLEPEADGTYFEVALLPIDGDDGDTKNTFLLRLPPLPQPAFLEFSAYGI
jgi:hypothetical protein